MVRDRADLGFSEALDDLDLSEFTPRKSPAPRWSPEETSQAAKAAGFQSREPKTKSTSPEGVGEGRAVPQRRRRTGRSSQFNLKARPETIAAYCALADRMGWGLGETLEKAVALLEEHYNQ
jgi:hypothetical protein